MKKIAVLNLEMGNVDSVARAVEECGLCPVVTNKANDLEKCVSIIFPGVGNFARAMGTIREDGIYDVLHEMVIHEKVPILGICLGMQLFATIGHEGGRTKGFGWIDGEVTRLECNKERSSIPHMGWNEVVFLKEDDIFRDIPSGKDFYFVHSFHFVCNNENDIMAYTDYCGRFVSVVRRENIVGVQFHPEKSQGFGLRMIRNFLSLRETI